MQVLREQLSPPVIYKGIRWEKENAKVNILVILQYTSNIDDENYIPSPRFLRFTTNAPCLHLRLLSCSDLFVVAEELLNAYPGAILPSPHRTRASPLKLLAPSSPLAASSRSAVVMPPIFCKALQHRISILDVLSPDSTAPF